MRVNACLIAGILGAFLALPGLGLAQQVPTTPTTVPQVTPPPPPTAAPSGQTNPTPSQGVNPPSDQKKENAAPPSANAPVDSNSYKVGPADILNVRVWGQPQFSGLVAVQQNGNITIPLLGDLEAGGKTPVEIQDIVGKALTKYVVKPLVTITVQDVGSKRYYMDGMVARPGEYSLVVPTTILEALSKAGGVGEFANSKHIYVLRGSNRIPFNYKDVLRGKHMDQNILLKPGDHVVVP